MATKLHEVNLAVFDSKEDVIYKDTELKFVMDTNFETLSSKK